MSSRRPLAGLLVVTSVLACDDEELGEPGLRAAARPVGRHGLFVAVCLLATLASGCAAARFEAAHRTCDRAAEVDAAVALGYAGPSDAGELRERAARNHAAAPPWVVGPSRVYPFDPSFRYWELWPADGGASTPLLCRLTYDRTRRRGLFAADPLTEVELTTVYEVPGKTPPQRRICRSS